MLEFALHNEVKQALRHLFGQRRAIYDTEILYVDREDFTEALDTGSLYYLVNETLDLPQTAKVVITSQNNLLSATKDSYNPGMNIKPFRSYLRVRTVNYGLEFVPFSLIFLKVTPYE